MLEPFITPTVATYNFNISSCNCSESVLLLYRALHWMQQINNREILWLCQVPSATHIWTVYIQHYRINYPELWVHLGNSGKLAPRESNLLYSTTLFAWLLTFCIRTSLINYILTHMQATLKARIGRKIVQTMVSTSEMGVTQGKVLMLKKNFIAVFV